MMSRRERETQSFIVMEMAEKIEKDSGDETICLEFRGEGSSASNLESRVGGRASNLIL